MRIAAAVFGTVLVLHCAAGGVEIVPREAVRPGMRGYGLTVFKGTTAERFDFEVLGTLKNAFPSQDIVVCRIRHPVTDKAGIISGMSGSPLYVVEENGGERLLGALAYGWSFQVDPIAGITPAYNMMDRPVTEGLPADPRSSGPARAAGLEVKQCVEWPMYSGARGATAELKPLEAAGREVRPAGHQGTAPPDFSLPGRCYANSIRPLSTPLTVSGASPRVLREIARYFESAGLIPVEGAGAGEAAEPQPLPKPEDKPFRAGDPIGVRLLSGDMDWTATGTVTWVDGARVYAFGHPFLGTGPVRAPMTKAAVLTVISRSYSSFKLTETGPEVGSLVFDHLSAIEGEIGRRTRTIPLEVTGAVAGTEKKRTFHYQVSEVAGLWPRVASYALWDSGDKMLPYGNACRVRSRITLSVTGEKEPFRIESSEAASSASPPVFELMALLRAVDESPFEKAGVESISVSMEIEPGHHYAVIERLDLPPVVRSEEKFRALVRLRPYGRGPNELETVAVDVAAPLVGARTTLALSAGSAARLRPPEPAARTLRELLEQRARIGSAEVLRVVVAAPQVKGAGANGMLLRHLPETVLQALGPETGVFNEGRETDVRTDYVLEGGASAAVEVIPR
ncbi:MAG: hypothetical protein JW909_03550 [Planctomycetes bacterium]|nr:hypothetical protein [Planctomycetota bacterium]